MSYLMQEYACECGERFESLESRGSVSASLPCPRKGCKKRGKKAISPVKGKVVWGWTTTGKSDPPPHGAMSTRHLAKG